MRFMRPIDRLLWWRRAVSAPSGDPSEIISVTDDGGLKALFETGAPHGLITGNYINILGTEVYDGFQEVAGILSPTTFITVDAYYVGSATGTWTLVEA